MAYYDQTPGGDDRPGCLDVWLITRAVLTLLFWPLAAILVLVLDLAAIIWLFRVWPALALIPVGVSAAAIAAYARWEQAHFRPHE